MAFKTILALGILATGTGAAPAAAGDVDRGKSYYAAPDGRADNPGSRDAPWDIASALGRGNEKGVKGGDTVWLRGGTYRHPDRSAESKGFPIALGGAEGRPITVRAMPGERVTIDGGLNISRRPSSHVVIRDLEVIVSENRTMTRDHRKTQRGQSIATHRRPHGGIELLLGTDIKVVNCVVHLNTSTGIGFWGAVGGGSELYGNIIYDNGFIAADRWHGPGIYTQNPHARQAGTGKDWKFIRDNIVFDNYSLNMQCTGSKAARIDRFHVERNIFYNTRKMGGRDKVVIGSYSGGNRGRGAKVLDNVHYRSALQIGYAGGLDDVVATGNTVVACSLDFNCTGLKASGNLVVREGRALLDGRKVPTPAEPRVFLHPNAYDPGRANLAIVNFGGARAVPVKAGPFLKPGDAYRLMDPADFFGKPVVAGRVGGATIDVPVKGMFAAYVVLKGGNSDESGRSSRR